MKELTCVIENQYQTRHGDWNIEYAVYDEGNKVASGISSDYGWVKHDAGGYHTKEKFDALYPNGWKVNFIF